MQTTLALPPKQTKLSHSKRESQSGSLLYGKISDADATQGHNSFDDIFADDNKIRVIARFRPVNKKELRWSKQNNILDSSPEFISTQQVRLLPSPLSSGSRISMDFSNINNNNSYDQRSFVSTLDSVLACNCSQKQVFYRCGLPMIMACLEGYNSTIFAYGQSGSGKTYTMMGPENNVKCADEFGLVPRCIIYLFQKLDERLSQNGGKLQDYIVNMELLQIYKTQLLDLLNPLSKKKLVIKTNFSTDGVFIQNLKSVQIQTVEESFKLLTLAQQNRIVAGHALNEVSSRSHMLIMMTVIQRCIDGTLKTCKLNFGDLAGSEDLTKTHLMNDMRRKEAIAINQSLSALTTAVSYLSRGQKPGFRDSPLTHILKDSLGGNSKTIMLVTVSPHIYNRGETIRTLRFASTAKKVKNKAKINEQKSIIALKKRIKELERENNKLRQQVIILKKNNKKLNDEMILKLDTHTDEKIDEMIGVGDSDEIIEMNSGESDEIIEMDDEWGSDSECDDMIKHFETTLLASCDSGVNGNGNHSDSEYGSEMELNEYISQLNEYREKLDRECEENFELQNRINDKNMELESCNNRIAQLIDELNQNETDFYDCKNKIKYLSNLLTQYQNTFPNFKPLELVSIPTQMSNSIYTRSKSGSGNYDEYNNNNNGSGNVLLENLLNLHQKMESQMKETEYTLNKIRRATITTNNTSENNINNNSNLLYENKEENIVPPINVNEKLIVNNKGVLVYESADEKLDEWDLNVKTPMGTIEDDNINDDGNESDIDIESEGDPITTSNSTKELKKHLKHLTKTEKKLKMEVAKKLKQEAKHKNNWCHCFWGSKPKQNDNEKEGNTGKLIEEYLKMQLRKDMIKDKYQRKKEKDRAKALKKRKNNDKKNIK